MRRLTERDKHKQGIWVEDSSCSYHFFDRNGDMYSVINKLAHYEDLEEAGKLIELPCAVGDTMWIVRENIHEATICRIVLNISESNNFINLDVAYEYVDWFYNDGRKEKATALCRYLSDAFLTKEEAEKALAELKGE